MTEQRSFPRRAAGATLGALDLFRRIVVNVVFIVLLLLVLSMLVPRDAAVQIDDGIAVVFDPYGTIVEEYDAAPVDRAVNRVLGVDSPQIRMRDLLAALQLAAEDTRVSALVLDLSGLQTTNLSKLQELAVPLAAARANGKRVLAYSVAYEQSHYYLASHADEISVHPMGGVFLEGYARYRMYMREAIDNLSIDWHVFKAGDFKSYGEPYERDDMSPQVREETAEWLGGMWEMYRTGVESARGFDSGAVTAYIDGMVDGVRSAGGDVSGYALEAGFVDQRVDYEGFVARVRDVVGAEDDDDEGFRGLAWEPYLAARRGERAPSLKGRDQVGLVVASGEIVDGDPGQHVVGGDRIAGLLADARHDDRIKALVLRVDSPGGSPFASEQIRAELQRLRDAGKPVVISMSSVAASGGYWISMSADEVWAGPATITGSIGVIGMFPTFDRGLVRLGLRTDGVGTTRFAGALRFDRPLSDEAATLVQLLVDGLYMDFLSLVADARGMEVSAVDAVAGGRVWSGRDAQQLGLVDSLGGMNDAIAAAARLADISEYAVAVVERPPTFRERLVMSFLESRALAPIARVHARAQQRPLARLLERVDAELGLSAALDSDRSTFLHCLCTTP
ncbi:MAG: signal peptide peptidase SppA [Gammaproteobacteria bacterium]